MTKDKAESLKNSAGGIHYKIELTGGIKAELSAPKMCRMIDVGIEFAKSKGLNFPKDVLVWEKI